MTNFAAALLPGGPPPGVKRQLDCAGVVTTVYSLCQALSQRFPQHADLAAARMQVSEDHCWLQLGAGGGQETSVEVTTDTAAKRGLPVAEDAWRAWLYTGGAAVLCTPHQALAALVTSLNPAISGGKKGVRWPLRLAALALDAWRTSSNLCPHPQPGCPLTPLPLQPPRRPTARSCRRCRRRCWSCCWRSTQRRCTPPRCARWPTCARCGRAACARGRERLPARACATAHPLQVQHAPLSAPGAVCPAPCRCLRRTSWMRRATGGMPPRWSACCIAAPATPKTCLSGRSAWQRAAVPPQQSLQRQQTGRQSSRVRQLPPTGTTVRQPRP